MAALSERLQDTIAPDLARFDRRRSVKQAYAQETTTRARTVSDAKPRSRTQGNIHVKPFSVAAFLAAFALLFLIVYSYMTISVLGNETANMRIKLDKLTNENAMLQKEYENRISLSELAEIASRDLGMVKPDRSQITYLDLSGEDIAIVIKKESFLVQTTGYIKEKIGIVLAYLG